MWHVIEPRIMPLTSRRVRKPMSYPTPPGGPGSANPYGQPPQQAGWQQQQWQGPVQMPPAPPGMQPVAPPGAPGGGGRTARIVTGSILGLFGVLALLGGGALAAHAYSNSQQTIVNPEYGEAIWSDEPADSIFPDTIGGRDGRLGDLTNPKYAYWRRLGISPETSCDKGLTAKTLAQAKQVGCKAVLRATYVDPTGDMVATVALIVLPGGVSKKQELAEAYEGMENEGAVAPLAVPGTLAAEWKKIDRNGSALASTSGEHLPYAVAATTGAVDGRHAGGLPGDWAEDYVEGMADKESWFAEAEILVSMFEAHMDDLQLQGSTW